ncbi:MAG: hypothetical protein R3E01_08350 [Pirellulaceae bacterium]|nr:hypothetical protein [Planctomycetales bacterium]
MKRSTLLFALFELIIGALPIFQPSHWVVHAEIIVDEFTDDGLLVSDEYPGGKELRERNVGYNQSLNRVFNFSSRHKTTVMDSNIEIPSALTLHLADAPEGWAGRPRFRVGYGFLGGAIDISNEEALLVDFASIEGTITPRFFQVGLTGSPETISLLQTRRDPLPLSSDGMTAVFPLEDFLQRDGSPNESDAFTHLRQVAIAFSWGVVPPLESEWHAVIERIRFGSIPVPEPTTGTVMALVFLSVCRRFRSAERRSQGVVAE